jgi:F0F1-type ATP synthase assembly protein I
MLGRGNSKDLARYAAIGQVGLEMAVPPVVGWYLDSLYGWGPWGVIIGAALGLVGGLVHLVHLANKSVKDEGPGPSDERKSS